MQSVKSVLKVDELAKGWKMEKILRADWVDDK